MYILDCKMNFATGYARGQFSWRQCVRPVAIDRVCGDVTFEQLGV